MYRSAIETERLQCGDNLRFETLLQHRRSIGILTFGWHCHAARQVFVKHPCLEIGDCVVYCFVSDHACSYHIPKSSRSIRAASRAGMSAFLNNEYAKTNRHSPLSVNGCPHE